MSPTPTPTCLFSVLYLPLKERALFTFVKRCLFIADHVMHDVIYCSLQRLSSPGWFLDAILKDHIFELSLFSYLRTSLLPMKVCIFLLSSNHLVLGQLLPGRNFS